MTTAGLADCMSYDERRQWNASMQLTFKNSCGTSVLEDLKSYGPLRVLNLFYPEPCDGLSRTCHCYLLHPPGGLVSGDCLNIGIKGLRDSRVLITTPAATKIYHADSKGNCQRQQVRIELCGSDLEWLPQETILYNGARPQLSLEVRLSADSSFIGSEIICYGRKACQEEYLEGLTTQRVSIYLEDNPVCLEQLRLEGGSRLLKAPYGMRGRNCIASVYAYSSRVEELSSGCHTLASRLESFAREYGCDAAVSFRNQLCVVKFIGDNSRIARKFVLKVLAYLRPVVSKRTLCVPRIWYS